MQYMKDDEWTSDGWKPIDHPSFMNWSSGAANFTIANMLNYFVHRIAADGCHCEYRFIGFCEGGIYCSKKLQKKV